jgi:hypothetical protein
MNSGKKHPLVVKGIKENFKVGLGESPSFKFSSLGPKLKELNVTGNHYLFWAINEAVKRLIGPHDAPFLIAAMPASLRTPVRGLPPINNDMFAFYTELPQSTPSSPEIMKQNINKTFNPKVLGACRLFQNFMSLWP